MRGFPARGAGHCLCTMQFEMALRGRTTRQPWTGIARGLATLARAVALIGVWACASAGLPAAAQTLTLRAALLPQWVVNQYRQPGRDAAAATELRAALDGGVVDRTVFAWQRGFIPRHALVAKPVRVLTGPEAAALGGRGVFRLSAVQPPGGRGAWTDVAVTPETGQSDGVLILEIGGELSTETQVLESLFLAPPDRPLEALPLVRVALIPGRGVQIVTAPSGGRLPDPRRFWGARGVEILDVRSGIDVIVNGDVTANGPADAALTPVTPSGDWREGDRVFLRISLATLRAGAPGLVLGWKDRTLRWDHDHRDFDWPDLRH
jgi:hypothetical protein